MMGLDALVAQYGWPTLAAIAVSAIVTSSIHGAIGIAGGLLMTAILALLIGVRPSVPVMSVALLISHGSRSLIYMKSLDFQVFLLVMTAASPFILLTGYIYSALPTGALAGVLAAIVFATIPLRHWAAAKEIKAGKGMLSAAGATYGFFAGASIGAAAMLSPFLLGFGLVKEAFVGTMASIALATNAVRIGIFGTVDLMTAQFTLLGVLVGLVMIPGNYIGRTILRRLSIAQHGYFVDAMVILGGLNFLYLALNA